MREPSELSVVYAREAEVVFVAGEIDAATASRFAEQLTQFPGYRVIVDVSEVTFIDSSGLNALIAAHRTMDHHHGVMSIRGAQPGFLRLLEITGLAQHIHVESP